MRKKRNRIYLGTMVFFLFIDLCFFWIVARDILFVPHIQETTGTIIHVDETTHNWDTGTTCEYSYTVDGVHYRGSFLYLCKKISPECTLGNRIAVSYYEEDPANARQGSAARTIGIFVLKCSMYLFWNIVFIVGWVLHITMGTKYHLSPRSL